MLAAFMTGTQISRIVKTSRLTPQGREKQIRKDNVLFAKVHTRYIMINTSKQLSSMSKIWREIADPAKHRDFMSNTVEGGVPIAKARNNLIEKWVYFVEVNGFIFQFANISQVEVCKNYFEQKIHPSTKGDNHIPHEHYWHPWYSKLPKGTMKTKTRLKVIKALDKCLSQWL